MYLEVFIWLSSSFIKSCLKFISTQPTIASSKLTIETLEQGVKYIQS